MFGLSVTDTWQLMNFHHLFPHNVRQRYSESDHQHVLPIKPFAGSLAAQLMKKAGMIEEEERLKNKKQVQQEEEKEEEEFEPIYATSVEQEDANDGYVTYTTPAGRKVYAMCSSADYFGW